MNAWNFGSPTGPDGRISLEGLKMWCDQVSQALSAMQRNTVEQNGGLRESWVNGSQILGLDAQATAAILVTIPPDPGDPPGTSCVNYTGTLNTWRYVCDGQHLQAYRTTETYTCGYLTAAGPEVWDHTEGCCACDGLPVTNCTPVLTCTTILSNLTCSSNVLVYTYSGLLFASGGLELVDSCSGGTVISSTSNCVPIVTDARFVASGSATKLAVTIEYLSWTVGGFLLSDSCGSTGSLGPVYYVQFISDVNCGSGSGLNVTYSYLVWDPLGFKICNGPPDTIPSGSGSIPDSSHTPACGGEVWPSSLLLDLIADPIVNNPGSPCLCLSSTITLSWAASNPYPGSPFSSGPGYFSPALELCGVVWQFWVVSTNPIAGQWLFYAYDGTVLYTCPFVMLCPSALPAGASLTLTCNGLPNLVFFLLKPVS